MKKLLTSAIFSVVIVLTSGLLASGQEPRKETMKFQGYEREYLIYVPEQICEGNPLVIVLHGHGGDAKGQIRSFMKYAQTYNFALCAPQGLIEPEPQSCPAWNVGYPFQKGWKVDDCAFILALIKKLHKDYGIDMKNVFFSGMSNGGEMCYYMAHRYPEHFAGIISLAGLNMEWIYREMRPSCAVPFIEVHGTADRVSRWEGDPENQDGWGKYVSVPAAVGRMVSNNCCTHEICDTLPVINKMVIRHQYVGGTDGKDVILYEIVGGGHSQGSKDFDLGGHIWAFMDRYITKK